jgi:hypothetical protein
MRRRMKREIQGEVFKTLEQYYHYSKVYSNKQPQEKEMDDLRRDPVERTED